MSCSLPTATHGHSDFLVGSLSPVLLPKAFKGRSMRLIILVIPTTCLLNFVIEQNVTLSVNM